MRRYQYSTATTRLNTPANVRLSTSVVNGFPTSSVKSLFFIRIIPVLILMGLASSCTGDTLNSPSASSQEESNQSSAEASTAGSKKRALLVAVGDYARHTGWHDLSAENDLKLMEEVLLNQGFSQQDIHKVHGKRVDKKKILDAFENTLLNQARPGDVVVFHYSGHGHRLTDDNHDEIDGYDEVLVPYDAPKKPATGYKGDRHIRDDMLGSLLTRLRRKVGASGDVIIILDSCNSGTGTRGEGEGDAFVRGAIEPIGKPQVTPGRQLGKDKGSGFVDARSTARGGSGDVADGLAKHVVYSAARHDQLAYETKDANGENVGSLTLAITSALSEASARDTYNTIFEKVKIHMAKRVRNVPQAEGDYHRELFGGDVVGQTPYYTVSSVNESGTKVKIGAGNLVGIFEGAVVELHSPGTREPTAQSLLVKGKIGNTDYLDAVVELEKAVAVASVKDAWVFVTEPTFGKLNIKVQFEDVQGSWKTSLDEKLSHAKYVSVVGDKADVLIKQTHDGVGVERAQDALPLLAVTRLDDPLLEEKVIARLHDFARNQYLRKVDLKAPRINVRFRLIPCRLKCEADEFGDEPSKCECVEDLPVDARLSQGGQLQFGFNDGFRIQVENVDSPSVYVAILDLMPDGSIGLLWPTQGWTFYETVLKRNESFDIPIVYQIGPPVGTDILKLFASREPIEEFEYLTSDWRVQSETPGASRGPLDQLFRDTFDMKRGPNPTIPKGSISTFAYTIQIEESLE